MSFNHLNELLRTQRQRLQADWDVEREMHRTEMREATQNQRELQNQLQELIDFKKKINGVFEEKKAEWQEAAKNREKQLKDELDAKWKPRVGKFMDRLNSLETEKREELDELTRKMEKMKAENNEMSQLVEKMKNEDAMKQEEIDKLAKMMKEMEVKNAQLVEKVQKDEAIKQETAKLIDQMTAEMEELKKLHNNEMAQIKQENRQKLEESELRCNGLEKQLASLMKQNVGDQIERRRHQSKREHQIESENNETKVSPKRQKIDSNATSLPVKNETKPDNFDADDVTYIGTTKRSEIKTPKVPFVAQQQNSQMTPSPIIQRGIVGSAVALSTREKLQNAESQKMAHQQPPAAHPSPQQIGHSSAQSNNLPAPTFGNCMDSRLADLSHRLNQLVQQEMPMHPYRQP